MFEGRVVNYSRLEFRLSVTAGVTDASVGTANYNVGGRLNTWQASASGLPSADQENHDVDTETSSWQKNIQLYVEETQAGKSWTFNWDERSITESGTGVNDLLLEIDNYRLYTRFDGTWRLRMGAARLYAGGVLINTYATVQIDSSEVISMRSMPGLSIPPELFGTCGASNGITLADAAAAGWSYTSEVTVEGTVTGGWRYVDAGDTVELPVTFPPAVLTVPPLSGSTAPLPTISGTTVWDTTLNVDAYEKNEDQWCQSSPGNVIENPYVTSYSTSGRVWLWPVLDHGVQRMNEPYEMLVVRGGLPQTTYAAGRTHYLSPDFNITLPGTTSDIEDIDDITPEHTEFLSVMKDTPGTIEDPLTQTRYAPCFIAGTSGEGAVASIGPYAWGGSLPATCPTPNWRTGRQAGSDTAYYEYPFRTQTRAAADDLTANPDMLAAYSHAQPMVRLYNYWFCLPWQYAPWFPPNTIDTNVDTIPDQQDVWQVYGNDIDVEYWLARRQQWIDNEALPPPVGLSLPEILGLGLGS